MLYELTNIIRPETDNWQQQRTRLQQTNGQVLTLAPNPGFSGLLSREGTQGHNLIDWVTQRVYYPGNYLYFNQIPTVTDAEIFMNQDRSISLISEGDVIGEVELYANTRRAVKSVTYLNEDGGRDFIEEYTFDGELFSRIFYDRNAVQEICFYDNQQRPVIRYYYYERQLNLVTIENPETREVITQYDTQLQFMRAQLAQRLTRDDQVNISYLGLELSVLAETTSQNTLYLEEAPLNEAGQVKGNLRAILTNEVKYVQHVVASEDAATVLKTANCPIDKLIIK